MNKMLVAVFETERQAYRAASAIRDLCEEGVLLAYAFAVIIKQVGKMSVVDFTSEHYPDPVLGVATRSLINLLARRTSPDGDHDRNATANRDIELANAGVNGDFLQEVARHLLPGKAGIVSEIEEEVTTVMDTVLKSQEGIIFRCPRRDVMDAEIARELGILLGEIQNVERQLLQKPDGSNRRLLKKLDLLKANLRATQDQARDHAASIKREVEAKIISLHERAAKTDGGIRARLERLADEVRSDYMNRATK
jgi:uncharacterized membrane protein